MYSQRFPTVECTVKRPEYRIESFTSLFLLVSIVDPSRKNERACFILHSIYTVRAADETKQNVKTLVVTRVLGRNAVMKIYTGALLTY